MAILVFIRGVGVVLDFGKKVQVITCTIPITDGELIPRKLAIQYLLFLSSEVSHLSMKIKLGAN